MILSCAAYEGVEIEASNEEKRTIVIVSHSYKMPEKLEFQVQLLTQLYLTLMDETLSFIANKHFEITPSRKQLLSL